MPRKVKLLYLSPLALQFDEFFPMINGFLKYVGVLIEVYTMFLFSKVKIISRVKSVFHSAPRKTKVEKVFCAYNIWPKVLISIDSTTLTSHP